MFILESSSRIFDASDHLRQCNVKKDHVWNFLAKKTTWRWRHVWPGDTWNVPPGPTTARGCRHPQSRHVCCRRRPLEEVGHAAWAGAGRLRWHMPPPWKPARLGTGRQRIPTLNDADSHAALIPTLTGVFFRRERPNLCVHVICNLCCFYLSIRCFDALFCTVNRLTSLLLKAAASRMQQALLIHSALSLRSLIHSALSLSLSLIHSALSLSHSFNQHSLILHHQLSPLQWAELC
jgi:hypothetical protein